MSLNRDSSSSDKISELDVKTSSTATDGKSEECGENHDSKLSLSTATSPARSATSHQSRSDASTTESGTESSDEEAGKTWADLTTGSKLDALTRIGNGETDVVGGAKATIDFISSCVADGVAAVRTLAVEVLVIVASSVNSEKTLDRLEKVYDTFEKAYCERDRSQMPSLLAVFLTQCLAINGNSEYFRSFALRMLLGAEFHLAGESQACFGDIARFLESCLESPGFSRSQGMARLMDLLNTPNLEVPGTGSIVSAIIENARNSWEHEDFASSGQQWSSLQCVLDLIQYHRSILQPVHMEAIEALCNQVDQEPDEDPEESSFSRRKTAEQIRSIL